MAGPIKSFEGLHKAFNEERQATSKELFDRALKGKLESVAKGEFECKLPPLTSIALIPVKTGTENERQRVTLNVRMYYTTGDGRERTCDWNIFADGVVSGRVPSDLPLTHDEITTEIYRVIESVHFDFWHKTRHDILPDTDEAEKSGGEGQRGKEGRGRPIDPERLHFLEEQPRVLFGFVDEKNGFRGYHGAVFSDRIVLEHPQTGNAAYVVPLQTPIPVDANTFTKPPSARVDDKTANKILTDVWGPISSQAKTRQELLQRFHARKIVHAPDTWKKRLQEAIDSLSETVNG